MLCGCSHSPSWKGFIAGGDPPLGFLEPHPDSQCSLWRSDASRLTVPAPGSGSFLSFLRNGGDAYKSRGWEIAQVFNTNSRDEMPMCSLAGMWQGL